MIFFFSVDNLREEKQIMFPFNKGYMLAAAMDHSTKLIDLIRICKMDFPFLLIQN